MSFCASCGRTRDETARFCGTCGAEYADPSDAQASPEDTARAAAPEGVTPTAIVSEAGPAEPLGEPDPFASWYQPEPRAGAQNAGSNWQSTQTVQATPGQAAGYPPSDFTAGNPFSSAYPVAQPGRPVPPGPQAPPPRRGGGGKGLLIAVAAIVVIAAGGGAYALATKLGKHSTAQPATKTSTGASSPTAGKSPSGGASPSASPSLVTIAPGVSAGTAQPQVETLLSHYFDGIDTHSYTEYASTLTATQLATEPEAKFQSGYASTTDSGMTLTGLASNGSGGLTATVAFTSRQSAAQSVDNSACNAWTLNLYLVQQGGGYLIGPAPSGYQPTYSDC
jgi:hypothetical protein